MESRGRNLLRKLIILLLLGGMFAGAACRAIPVKAQAGGKGAALVGPGEGGADPKTGDDMQMKVYLAIAAAAGSGFLLLYLTDHGDSMTEETKKKHVEKWTRWAQKGGRVRRTIAIAIIFLLLLYYHAIGKEPEKKEKENKKAE